MYPDGYIPFFQLFIFYPEGQAFQTYFAASQGQTLCINWIIAAVQFIQAEKYLAACFAGQKAALLKGGDAMKKIGLACAGSGPPALLAHLLVSELEALSLPIHMISCTSIAAYPLLLWNHGIPLQEISRRMQQLVHEKGARTEWNISDIQAQEACRDFAVSAVDIVRGTAMIWSDSLHANAENLEVHPLSGYESVALKSAACPWRDSRPVRFEGRKLADFASRYGCPFFPLKMAGMERLLSVVFAGETEPSGAAMETLAILSGKNADIHLTFRLENTKKPEKQIQSLVRSKSEELYQKLLF